tara:strand:- start:225 stop:551 length:327 start_codon:yes stop_codon:yes gene_type:complete
VDLNKQLQKRLKALMKQERMLDSQRRVAAASQVAQSSVNRILNNTQSATLDMVSSLAKAFKIKPDRYLLLDEEEAKVLSLFHDLDPALQKQCIEWMAAVAKKGSDNGS